MEAEGIEKEGWGEGEEILCQLTYGGGVLHQWVWGI